MEKDTYGKILKELVDMCDGVSEDKWNDIVERYDLGIHKDSLRKAFGTTEFSGYSVYKYLTENDVPDDRVDELKEKIRELEIKKIQYQDERRVNSKYMRPLARHERIIETIREEMVKFKPLEYKKVATYIPSEREASLLISDLHYGIKCNNYWNKYNMDIANKRMFKLVEDTIRYCEMFNVETLHIELLGDLISGYIHKTLELENEVNVVQQTLKCADLLAVCINKLADTIPNVKVYMTVGNHGRMNPNKKESVDEENFEYFIWDGIQQRCKRDDVAYMENDIDETMIHYTVNGEHVFGVHGHLDKVGSVIQNFSTMFNGMKIKAIHEGHLHHEFVNEFNGIKVIMNSTGSGVDTHSKNLRYVGNPSQTLLIYDGDNTLNFNIRL